MINDINALIHDIAIKESGLYSGLFGFDGFDILKTVKVSWMFKEDDDLYNTIKIFMDYLIYLCLVEYGTKSNKPNNIQLNGQLFTNPFTKDGLEVYDIEHGIFNDLENTDLDITIQGDLNIITLNLPIYDI